MSLKRTPLFENHRQLDARLVGFAGWEMPISYDQYSGGIKAEHLIVREKMGIFDVSHMGEFWITGPQAAGFLSKACTRDYEKAKDGRALYALVLNADGGILDDVIVYRFSFDKFLMVVNASNISKIWGHLQTIAAEFEVSLEDKSDQTALIALQGPEAADYLKEIYAGINELKYYSFSEQSSGEIVGRTGYTGEDGFEIFLPAEKAAELWNRFLKDGIKPIGLGARDSLRLEVGFPLYGNDLSEDLRPQETLSSFAMKSEQPFLGKQASALKPRYRPQGLLGDSPKPFRSGAKLVDASGKELGWISSGGYSPRLKKGIGLALVKTDSDLEAGNFFLESLGKRRQVTPTSLPFVETSRVKKRNEG